MSALVRVTLVLTEVGDDPAQSAVLVDLADTTVSWSFAAKLLRAAADELDPPRPAQREPYRLPPAGRPGSDWALGTPAPDPHDG